MKNKKELRCRAIFYSLLILLIACLIAAICLYADYPTLSYCLFGGAGAAAFAQLFVATGITFSKSNVKVNGYKQWATAIIVFFLIVMIVALLPLIILLRIVDAVRLLTLARHPEPDM